MARRKRNNPSGSFGLVTVLAVGGIAYLAYRKWRGLGNGDYEVVAKTKPVTPVYKPITPTFWQKAYSIPQTTYAQTQQGTTPSPRPLVMEPPDPKYLKFREKRIAAGQTYDIWSPAPISAESAAMSFVLPVVKTPVTAMLEETEHQRAYNLQNEIKDAKGEIEAALDSVFRWMKEYSGAYEFGMKKLKEQESVKARARTQDEIDKADDEILSTRFGLANIVREAHKKNEEGYDDAARSIEGTVDGIREKYGDDEAEKAKLELTMAREFLIRKYTLLPEPNSKEAGKQADALMQQIEQRQEQKLILSDPASWMKSQEAKQERARQEAEQERIAVEEEKLRSNPLLQTPGQRRSPLYTASASELEKVTVSPEVEERLKEFAKKNVPVPNEEGIQEVPKVGSPRFRVLAAMMQIRVDDLKNR